MERCAITGPFSPYYQHFYELSNASLEDNIRSYLEKFDFFIFKTGLLFDLSFGFRSPKAYYMWKSCFLAAIDQLGLPDACLYSKCSLNSTVLSSSLELGEVLKIFEYLKPLSRRSFFEKVFIGESVQICEEFLADAPVKMIEFCALWKQEVKNFEPWLDIVRKISPLSVSFDKIMLTPALENCLVRVAGITDSIHITNFATEKAEPLPISIIKEIMSKRCKHLDVGDMSIKYSRGQVSELVQFLQETDKRVSLFIPPESEHFEERIGDYILQPETINSCGQILIMKHREIEHKITEDMKGYLEDILVGPTTSCENQSFNGAPYVDVPAEKRRTIEYNLMKDDDTTIIRKMLDITQVLQNIIEKKLLDFENEFKMDQTKKFVVDTLWLSHMNEFTQKCSLSFSFTCSQEQRLWAAFFIAALSIIGISGHTVFTNNVRGRYSKHTVSWTPTKNMKNPDQFRRLAILLKTLAVRTTFNTIRFIANNLEMVNFCAEMVEHSHVKSLQIMSFIFTTASNTEIEDFTYCIRLVQKVRPIDLRCPTAQLTNGLIQFLMNVADVAERIRIESISSESGALLISCVRKLCLGSKCTSVAIYKSEIPISFDEIEPLLQLFHHLKKKMSLYIPIAAPLPNSAIGEYRIVTGRGNTADNMLSIRHNNL